MGVREGFSIDIKGAKEIERKLMQLPKAAAGKVTRKSLRAGAKVVQKAAKAKAVGMVGGAMGKLLKRAIVVRAARKRKRGEGSVNAQLSSKLTDQLTHTTKSGRRYYIPAAIEYGHGADKATAARPFMRAAFDESKRQAVDEVLRTMRREIDLAARKV